MNKRQNVSVGINNKNGIGGKVEKEQNRQLYNVLFQPFVDIESILLKDKTRRFENDYSLIRGFILLFSNIPTKYLQECSQTRSEYMSYSKLFIENTKLKTAIQLKDFNGLKNEIQSIVKKKYSIWFTYLGNLIQNLTFLYLKYVVPNGSIFSEFYNTAYLRIIAISELLMYSMFEADVGNLRFKTEDGFIQEDSEMELAREDKNFQKSKNIVNVTEFPLNNLLMSKVFIQLYNNALNILVSSGEKSPKDLLDSIFTGFEIDELTYILPFKSVLENKNNLSYLVESVTNELNEKSCTLFLSTVSNISYTISKSSQKIEQDIVIRLIEDSYVSLHSVMSNNEKEFTEQLKALKSDVKSKNKELNQKDKELNSLNLEIEKNRQVVEQQQEIQKTNSSFVELKDKVERLEKELTEKIAELNKLDVKKLHTDNEIVSLKQKLKEYSTIETDMMILQNENNILKSEIDAFESLDTDDEMQNEEYNKKLLEICNIPILFVGGVGNMMSKFMKLFPNSDYIDVSNEGTSFIVPPRFQYVVIYTKIISHSHCERIESQISNKKIIPINIFNSRLVVNEIYNVVHMN